ncbi:MAG: antitoxin Xre/MbcA/ParS toxin-binding domain-containing protein, partial [Terracidiphilus sp.]
EGISTGARMAEPGLNMLRYRGLVSRAVEAFGDEIKASRWLSLPNGDLDGQTPIQAVQANGYDMQVLEPILTRIEHGVDY